jgi:hypothetical protein
MRRTPYDPLTHIPAPETVRRHLADTEALARRLRLLLCVSEALHKTNDSHDAGDHEEARHAE